MVRCRPLLSTIGALLAGIAASGAAESELEVGLDLTLEASTGLKGGLQRGETLHGLALGYVDWNRAGSDESGPGFRAYGSVLVLTGRGPTERFIGDFLAASNMEGHSSTRLYSWWLESNHRGWSLRGGALLADEEFAGTEGGGNFFNSAFGWPAFISANTVNTGPAFYVPALGLRLERTWDKAGVWRIGVYDGDPFDSPDGDPRVTRHGWRYRAGSDQGWFVITEAVLAPDGKQTRLKAGAWLHTAAFSDVRDDAAGQPFAVSGAAPRMHSSNYGAYVAVERGWAGGVETFLRAGASPGDRNAIAWALDAGVSWTGPLPGRPDDRAFIGVVHADFSSRYSENLRLTDPANPPQDFEQVIEAGYNLALTERWSLQPDVQFIRHPGGNSGLRNAVVFLLRANVSY